MLRKIRKIPATDLYCRDCGAWQKFATKDEIRLYENANSELPKGCYCWYCEYSDSDEYFDDDKKEVNYVCCKLNKFKSRWVKPDDFCSWGKIRERRRN